MMPVEPPPPPLGGLHQLEDHSQARRPRTRTLRHVRPRPNWREDALDRVGRAKVDPMLGRVVVEGEQGFLLGGDLFDGLRPLRPELARKRLEGLFGLSLVFRAGDLPYGRLRPRMHTLWHRIEDVRGFMDPVPLNAGLGEDIPQRAPEAQSPVAA